MQYINTGIQFYNMPYLPEVVRIIAAHVETPLGGKAIGTGFFLKVDGEHVKEEGLLLTNAHVVTNSPVVKIMTTYIEHQALPVTVVSLCHDRDLALLKVEPEIHQWLKRTLKSRYGLDHIPCLSFADSDTLRTGLQLHAVGHPMGLIDQQFTSGAYQGCVHLNNEIRGLQGAAINGGNSGGPLLWEPSQKFSPAEASVASKPQEFEGIHYFQPSRYELMGINTFKLTGANVDGENGFIHSNTVKTTLPILMKPLEKRYKMESEILKKLNNAVVNQSTSAAPNAQAVAFQDHLSSSEMEMMHTSGIESAWTENNLGGKANGKPRTFVSWLARHVYQPMTNTMHQGGPELLSKVLGYAADSNWQGLMDWKNKRRWHEVRQDMTQAKGPENMPAVVRFLPPAAAHVHSPQVGITSHPLYTSNLLVHYQCPKNEDMSWVANGGVVVTHVAPKSMYEHAGGLEGDVIYKFKSGSVVADLAPGGTWYSKKRDLPMSLIDLCNDVPIRKSITMSVLRKGGKTVELTFENREPTYGELPAIRQTYAFCDEGKFEAKQKAQVQGIVFSPLRLQHVQTFKLLDYMAPNKRYNFKIVVENVSPESPAYSIDALHAGAIVTHINDEPVANTWTDFCAQVAKPHAQTGCWAIDTEYNGQKGKYVMIARQLQTK